MVSALAIHHTDAAGKADLFHRVRARLRPGGLPDLRGGARPLGRRRPELPHKAGSAIRGGGPVPPVARPPGPEIGGIPSGLAGWALAALGVTLLSASIALYAAAASRRRRACRTFP